MYSIGFDVGSSSVKGAIVNSDSGELIALEQEPAKEMGMISSRPGWAEQDPDDWWKHICKLTKKILTNTKINPVDITGIGIAYQMHGLVAVDSDGLPLRPSIIWCDGRAVQIGNTALNDLGVERCTEHLLNSPGNFTASKLKWIKDNEPDLYQKIYKIMLPGDYIAYKFSNELRTTVTGLSEGIFWDFKSNKIADFLLDYFEIDRSLLAETTENFAVQGQVSHAASKETGLNEGTPIFYRAGDQPNNALSLNVFEPGEIAATGGTSGVIYAVTDSLSNKEFSRLNNFAHLNHNGTNTRIGKLLCINGTGILYRWLMNNLKVKSYDEMNDMAQTVETGANGLQIYPFGNGPERVLNNLDIGARFVNLNFNIHSAAHLCRAALEGIAFSFAYGLEIMKGDGIRASTIRTGNDNLFRSEIFAQLVSSLLQTEIEIYNTTGAVGAARACSIHKVGLEQFKNQLKERDFIGRYAPQKQSQQLEDCYQNWKDELQNILNNN